MGKVKSIGKGKKIINVFDSILVWGIFFVAFVILPFYFEDGYNYIVSSKYLEFVFYTYFLIRLFIVLLIIKVIFKRKIDGVRLIFSETKIIDIFVLSFIAVAALSYLFSYNKICGDPELTGWLFEGAFWGSQGWYMGLATYVILTVFYFSISRSFSYNKKIYILIIISAVVISIWGILNRYRVVPVDMGYDYEQGYFLASIGNINWIAGFLSVVCPVSWGLYLSSDKKLLRNVLFVVNMILFYMIFVNQSDSIIFGTAVVCAFLLWYSLDDYSKMIRFLELLMSMFLSGTLLGVADRLFEDYRIREEGVLENLYGLASFAALLLVVGVYVYLKKKQDFIPNNLIAKIKKAYIITICVIVVGLVALLIVNTMSNGEIITSGTAKSLFMFDSEWGRKRATTWKIGFSLWANADIIHKLFGCGPDTFFFEMNKNPELYMNSYNYFEGARLVNAHNEWLTLLVNVGLLGVVAFVGFLYVALKSALKYAKQNKEFVIFALVVICYTANNMFSFQHLLNIPLLFTIIGIESAAIVKADANEV